MDHLNEINKRVDAHENFINKLDKDLALSDFEINILNDKLAEPHINDLPSTLNSHLKHELTVVRNEMNQLRDKFSTKVCKAESELIKLRGRVGSLLEEKGNLVKKVKELEIQNESLKGHVLSLHDNFVKQHSEILPPETLRAEILPEIKVTNPTSPVTVSTPQDRHRALITSEEISTAEPTAIQQNGNGEPQDKSLADNKDNEIHDYDFVMLCDSNRKFLNINRLCNNRNSKMIPCNTTTKAMEIIDTPRFKVSKALIINIGVNDAEHLTPEEIINNQIELVEKAMSAFPNAKIILSDITPRDDKCDVEVPRINDGIDRVIKSYRNVFHVYNGNLRYSDYYHHVKHLSRKYGVPALARNIKSVLREAFQSPARPEHAEHYRSAKPPPVIDSRPRHDDNTVITPTQHDRVHSLAMDPRPDHEDNAARNQRQANVQTLPDQPSY